MELLVIFENFRGVKTFLSFYPSFKESDIFSAREFAEKISKGNCDSELVIVSYQKNFHEFLVLQQEGSWEKVYQDFFAYFKAILPYSETEFQDKVNFKRLLKNNRSLDIEILTFP